MTPTESPPGLSRRKRALLLLWVLAASWALLEVALQLAAVAVANQSAPEFEESDGDAFRIVAVGDSWVDGAEAPDGEGFVDHLGRDIVGLLAPGTRVQLTNLGRTGANSAYVALTTDAVLPSLLPDLLVVLVGQNNATNFYGVAEVEQLLGERGSQGSFGGLRTVKLARIALANWRGQSGYRTGEKTSLPEVVPMRRDDQDNPLNQLRVFGSEAGQRYLRREVTGGPPPTTDSAETLAWKVLYSSVTRDLSAAQTYASQLRPILGIPDSPGDRPAPQAVNDRELLGRYALLRLARQERDWQALRHHAGAFVGYRPRGLMADLGAAEAHLLAGDWRSARAYLQSAHNQAPGFLDTIDLASRIPAPARNPAVYEALEFRPLGIPLAYELVAVFDQTNKEDSSLAALRAWLAAVPDDDTMRADLGVLLVNSGKRPEADGLMGVVAGPGDQVPQPESVEPALWRYLVTRAKATGDRDHTLDVVESAMQLPGLDAGLLGAATRALSAHQLCEALPEVADRWFTARGDANTYSRLLAPCSSRAVAAARLDTLRDNWSPLGDRETWTALVKAGHKPFELLYRDLDLVLDRAEEVGATVVLLNYPNPSTDHTALRELLSDYAASRTVEYVDTYGRFAERFSDSPESWREHLGPNGHANRLGYRLMAEDILDHLRRRHILDAP